MEQNVFVEILDQEGNTLENGKEGDIYITSLNNYAMPFIRYAIGDRGILLDNTCNCKRRGRIIKLTTGRSSEMAETKNGERVSGYVFTRTVHIINQIIDDCIKQYQVIQKSYDEFVIRMVLDEECD
jgi:phenylacetate-CoA ligase